MENKIDKKVKNYLDRIINIKPSNIKWNPNESWKKIKEQIDIKNKSVILWYFATAASFSILVASNISLNPEFILDKQKKKPKALDTENIKPLSENPEMESNGLIIKENILYNIRSKPLKLISTIKPNKVKELHKIPYTANAYKTSCDRKTDFEFSVSGNTTIRTGARIGFRVVKSNDRRTSGFGINIDNQIFNPSNSINDYPLTILQHISYIQASFSTQKSNSKNGFNELNVGYLLNTNMPAYQQRIYRIQYLQAINKHIKVGPEIIFSKNLKAVFPGFSFTIG